MEKQEDINNHIVNYFLQGKIEITDPILIKWLGESETNKKLFNQYAKIWNESEFYMEKESFDTGKAWKKVNEIHQRKENSRNRFIKVAYTISGVAASLLIMFILSLLGFPENKSTVLVSMSTAYGNRSEVTLPDGSIVRLNAGSDITYSYNPKEKIREVHFQGEGFFDIARSETPFIVKLENTLEIKVLGTSFNLHAYKDDRNIQTSLIEGHVELNHDNKVLEMQAGEMAVFNKETNKLKLSQGVLSHTYGWLDSKLYMDNMSLNDVCKHLERWFNVEITIQQELGENIHYNGVIKEESIADVMNALCQLSNINYQIKGKQIRITSK